MRLESARATFRELAHRVDGGIEVTLLWCARENRLAVTVLDGQAQEVLVIDAESEKALDVFYHPYGHAGTRSSGARLGSGAAWSALGRTE
jgi:hypothetical protein